MGWVFYRFDGPHCEPFGSLASAYHPPSPVILDAITGTSDNLVFLCCSEEIFHHGSELGKENSVKRMPLLPAMLIGLSAMIVFAPGCQSPYHSDQGALLGGVLGTGTGAVIGAATGHPLAGAAIGAGVGAVSGAAIGSGMDESEARNRAMIAQQLGRQVAAGSVTTNDVIAMTKAGVNEELIANHVRANGMAAPLQANDLIQLQQQGVSPKVIAQMQASPPRPVQPVVVGQPGPTPVIIEEYRYSPYWGPHYYYPPPPCHRQPGVSWGVAVGN
jgi:hypothetical protein